MNIRVSTEYDADAPKLHHGIKCLTCKTIVLRKKELPKYHRGHDVQYIDEDGNVKE